MAVSDFRRRVELLLTGDLTHLDRLLLFVRDRCDGRKTVREIGDLIAHPNRDKGVLREAATKFFIIMRFQAEYHNKSPDFRDLPPNFLLFLDIMCSQVDRRDIKHTLGINRRILVEKFNKIKMKFSINDKNRMYLNSSLSDYEFNIIKFIASKIHVKPAFTADFFIKEFLEVLKSNNILSKNEISAVKFYYKGIILYVMACMHNCDFILDDGSVALAWINVEGDGSLSVRVIGEVPFDGLSLSFTFPIFLSELSAAANCDHELLLQPHPWKFPVYVDEQHRLKRL